MESILTSTKKLLGITEEYTHFDMDIIIHINSAFAILTQLGVGPSEGFSIENEYPIWSDFISSDDKQFQMVKTYVYMKVRLVFDPPTNSSHLQALKDAVDEYEWRLNVAAESKSEEV